MFQKIRNWSLTLASIVALTAPMLVPIAVSADCNNAIQQNVAVGVNDATSGGDACNNISGNDSNGALSKIAKQVVNTFSVIVGIVAVLFVIYGGFRYITSGGDSGSVGNAKNTLIYAIVGLVIVALAQLIVHYVLSTASSVTIGN